MADSSQYPSIDFLRVQNIIAEIADCECILNDYFHSQKPHKHLEFEIDVMAKKKQGKKTRHSNYVPINIETFSVVVGKRIKNKREQLDITQKKLAEITGIKRPNIARLENGASMPNLLTLIRVATGLNTNLDSLLANS